MVIIIERRKRTGCLGGCVLVCRADAWICMCKCAYSRVHVVPSINISRRNRWLARFHGRQSEKSFGGGIVILHSIHPWWCEENARRKLDLNNSNNNTATHNSYISFLLTFSTVRIATKFLRLNSFTFFIFSFAVSLPLLWMCSRFPFTY